MTETLTAIHDGHLVGEISYRADRLNFGYAESWRADPYAFPLSLSMPLSQPEHGDTVVRSFLSGLLPDDNEVLRRWGRKFHVSPRNPFRLLFHIGEECAGAVQFVPRDRASAWLDGAAPEGIAWMSDPEFVGRIQSLAMDRSEARHLSDEGHFSLAGAQAKTALYRDPGSGRWGIPKGSTPTTHIIKPNRGEFEAFEINEHFCLQLANRLGLTAAKSWTETIGGIPAIIIERYDRTHVGERLIRIHQEDTCQALGRIPEIKYQNLGGPSAGEIFELIRNHSSKPQEDVLRFLDALIFNYLIGGTDAHAKNYSLLIAGDGQVRLAPLYDLISILPYGREPKKVKLAMKIGGDYLLWKIGAHHWAKAAKEWNLDRERVLGRIARMADAISKASEAVGGTMAALEETERGILLKLMTGITERAESCLHRFAP